MKQRRKFPSSGGKKGGMLLVILLVGCLMSSLAQVDIQVVMKNGSVSFQSDVSGIDSIVFYNPSAPVNTPSADILVVKKTDSSPAEQILLDEIRKLTLTDGLSLIPKSGSTKSYSFAAVTALNFEERDATGINTPVESFDVNIYLTPQGEVIVQTDALIHSLTLFSMEGKTLDKSCSNMLSIPHLPAGVYLLRVETAQGTVVKKVINHSNIR